MQGIIPFPQKKKEVLITNTFTPPVQTVTFRLDETHIIIALHMPTFSHVAHVHVHLLCGEYVTTTHVYYAYEYFTTHFPHIHFSFCAERSEAVVAAHILVCCTYDT